MYQLADNIIDRLVVAVKNIFGAYWERNVTTLTYRINWNKGIYCYMVQCLDYFAVEKIVAIYFNLAKEGKIPEYDRKNNPSKITFIENEVQKIYNQNINDVKTTLYNLYFATLDGTLTTSEFLKPKTYNKNIETIHKPDTAGNEESFTSEVLKMLRFLLWAIIIGAGAYGGYMIYNNFYKPMRRK